MYLKRGGIILYMGNYDLSILKEPHCKKTICNFTGEASFKTDLTPGERSGSGQ